MSGVQPVLLAISGPIGAGKTTLAAALSDRLGWPRAAYGDLVRAVATSRGLGHDRTVLQQVGTELITGGWELFTRRVLAMASWKPGEAVIVDGIRHAAAVTALRHVAAPMPVVVVYLNIPARAGLVRARQRDYLPSDPGQSEAAHPVEQDLPAVRRIADLDLQTGDSPPGVLAGRVISHLAARHPQQPGGRCA